ncbi:hypothetical protein [Bradyrhizobium sp. CCBAU 53421]|uniref:hypothetical protein n=1 Tax=Bradyrhizobium sp. CCBAU 53421 TaxID=1325120 RepID=UPI00188AC6D1|nr:hypothetical protein [Bradyrhizobium sp. CCBAU 53421]QOZ32830.1 hypothetical protein XH92_14970 [Bradyrhizobium sp. CCBAU 53421]
MLLSGLYDEFAVAKKTTIAKMSPGQLKKWKNGKLRAVELLITVTGDKAIRRLTRDDALKYTDHWTERVVDGEVLVATANRNLTHITGMLSAVSKRHRLNLDRVFAGARLEGDASRPRPPFSPWWIVNRLLAPGALETMNDEERAVVLVMINTGARPSEIINLRRRHIVLDAPIPHVRVRPDGRVLKTAFSDRDIPLIGVSLEAMQQFPNGFPHYREHAIGRSQCILLRSRPPRDRDSHTLFASPWLQGPAAQRRDAGRAKGRTDGPRYQEAEIWRRGHGLDLKRKYIQLIALVPGMQMAAPLRLVRTIAS